MSMRDRGIVDDVSFLTFLRVEEEEAYRRSVNELLCKIIVDEFYRNISPSP
jgi:hypothetical protein